MDLRRTYLRAAGNGVAEVIRERQHLRKRKEGVRISRALVAFPTNPNQRDGTAFAAGQNKPLG